MAKYTRGDTCYILENNQKVTKVSVINNYGGMYTISLCGSNSVMRLRENRLFRTEDEALDSKHVNLTKIEENEYGYVDVFAGRRNNRNPHR